MELIYQLQYRSIVAKMDAVSRSRSRFIKDVGCKIPTTVSPYFEHFLSVYNLTDRYARFQLLQEELSKVKPITALYEPLKVKPCYKEVNSCDINTRYPLPNATFNGNVYLKENLGKTFLTVDLKEAAYQALYTFDPEIVSGARTFSDFVDIALKETSVELRQYVKECKPIRTVALGNLNSGRLQHIYRWITLQIEQKITPVLQNNVVLHGLRSDEVIYVWNNETPISMELIEAITQACLPYRVTVENFRLDNLHPNYAYYSRTSLISSNQKIKCVKPLHYVQVHKRIHGLPLHEHDLVFTYEGELCQLLKPIY